MMGLVSSEQESARLVPRLLQPWQRTIHSATLPAIISWCARDQSNESRGTHKEEDTLSILVPGLNHLLVLSQRFFQIHGEYHF